MLFDLIDSAADDFGKSINFPGDQIKMVICLLISFPIGFIFKRIRNVTARHTFSILLGLFYLYLIYRNDVIYPFILWLFTYFTLKFFGRKTAPMIFMLSMAYLAALHAKSMYQDWGGYRVDVTSTMMLTVCKCTSFAWCYKDGGENLNKLSAEQKIKRIEKLPSLFEYLSYVSFYGSILVGPGCDYKDHETFIKQEGDYTVLHKSFVPSIGYLMFGLINMGLLVLLAHDYNAAGTITPEYVQKSFMGKFIYLTIAMTVHRFRYYTVWLMGTANVTAAGLNYNPNGKDIFEKYGKIVAVRPLQFEKEDNLRDKLECWNTACQLWLKNYVYFRVCSEEEAKKNPAKATLASNLTFMASALWHGFYPGYYLAFFVMFLVQQNSRSLFKIKHKLAWIKEPFGYIIRWLITGFYVNFFGNTFALLEFSKTIIFFEALYYIPYILPGVLFLLFSFTSLGKAPRTSKANGSKDKKETVETKKEQ